VFFEFDLESGGYPGEDAISAQANDRCFAAIRG
jgi:hypothetical protein